MLILDINEYGKYLLKASSSLSLMSVQSRIAIEVGFHQSLGSVYD